MKAPIPGATNSPGFDPRQLIRPGVGWITVAMFIAFGSQWMRQLDSGVTGPLLFAWLFGVIVWGSFGVVHEAEALAHLMGEPLGTLVLTLSIVLIEVVLISAVMLGAGDTATLARDTMYSVLMIVLNGVVGLGLLIGGIRHHEQAFNLHGASAYLAVIIPLATIALILPNFTTSTYDGTLTGVQAVSFSCLTLALYGLFLWLQTGRHMGYFVAPPVGGNAELAQEPESEREPAVMPRKGEKATHFGMLLVNILPIVILAKSLAKVLDHGITVTGAPRALGGVIIAMLVFAPEGISAIIAIRRDELTRAINLCLGAAASTVGLTVPAVLAIGLFTGKTVTLGLPSASIVLLASTLVLSGLTFSGWRTTMLEGAVHLSMFVVFLVLIFSP
jgi:Ca2+:H+ antiporter